MPPDGPGTRRSQDAWPIPKSGWPPGLWAVPYQSTAIPTDDASTSWLDGSNCQRFAYGVLALFELACPPLRSSELWEDVEATKTVEDPGPLDLALFNTTAEPFGAHIGIWMAPNEILHLCAEVGSPAIWPLDAFAARPRYAILIGFKRAIAPDKA